MSDGSDRLADLRTLLAEKLGTKGRDLRAQVRRAGRRLPRAVRREAEFLARAESMARHPRFARLVDARAVARAERKVARHLRSIDPALRRGNRRKNAIAAFGLYVLVTFGLVVALLWWRGLA